MPQTVRLVVSGTAEADPAIAAAARILRDGGLVAFPTETVYGLGALGLHPEAVARIFLAKQRPSWDPLILHIPNTAWLPRLCTLIPPQARQLADAFWPGPLTLVLPRRSCVPDLVTAGLDTVAVRVPAHPVALALLRCVGEPLAAPSANLFTRPSPTTARHVLHDLDGRIDAVLDAGATPLGIESTVLDLSGADPVVLRPGVVTRGMIEQVLGVPVTAPPRAGPGEGAHSAPGMMERHYSPAVPFLLLPPGLAPGELAAAARKVSLSLGGATPGVLAFDEDADTLRSALPEAPWLSLGSCADLTSAGRLLYAGLRTLESAGVPAIVAVLPPIADASEALRDRMLRAAAGRVVSTASAGPAAA